MFCVKCGKENPDSGSFCWSCGSALFKDASLVQQDIGSEPIAPPNDNQPLKQETVVLDSILIQGPEHDDSAPIEIELPQAEKAPTIDIKTKELKGLGGWLILVGFGLIIGICFWIYGIYQDVILFNNGTVQFMSDPASSVHIPGYSGLLKFELICQLTMIGTTVCLLTMFFGKNRRFPLYYTAFLIVIVIYGLLDYLLLVSASVGVSPDFRKSLEETLTGQESQIPRSAIGALIWGFYMKKSERVKATFIN